MLLFLKKIYINLILITLIKNDPLLLVEKNTEFIIYKYRYNLGGKQNDGKNVWSLHYETHFADKVCNCILTSGRVQNYKPNPFCA